jgi:hypothetical protein
MILGASHMTLACADIAQGAADLATLGYRVEFIDTALPSHPGKAPMLSTPREIHAIAFARATRGLPIELVSYDSVLPEQAGRFVAIFGQAPLSGSGTVYCSRLAVSASAALEGEIVPGILPGFDVPAAFTASTGQKDGVIAAILPVRDISRAAALWCEGIGFKITTRGSEWARLDFVSPVATWRFCILLIEGPSETASVLDGRGMTCLSFVCSDLATDREILVASGAQAAMAPFAARVNGKNLIIEILRGGDGEFIELLQVNERSLPSARR